MNPALEQQKIDAPISPEPLLRALIGFEVSQVLMTAHQLQIFETLAQGPQGIVELCESLGLPMHSGERLLNACVSLNFLEIENKKLKNSAAVGAYLDSRKSSYLGGLFDYYRTDVYASCARLPEAILQNGPQVSDHEKGQADVFTAMAHQKELARRFHQAMHSLGLLEGKRLAEMYPFERIQHLVDVGGGSGALAISLAEQYPHLEIDLVDHPTVCQTAELFIEEAGLTSRIKTVPADFWKDPIPENVDAILLSMVLHDWNPEECLRLLKNCANALKPGGQILIYEQLLNEDRQGPSLACLTNLIMLLRTRSGSEYTEMEYRAMLDQAGFHDMAVERRPGIRHLLHAKKR